jgi:hypothetical protein
MTDSNVTTIEGLVVTDSTGARWRREPLALNPINADPRGRCANGCGAPADFELGGGWDRSGPRSFVAFCHTCALIVGGEVVLAKAAAGEPRRCELCPLPAAYAVPSKSGDGAAWNFCGPCMRTIARGGTGERCKDWDLHGEVVP